MLCICFSPRVHLSWFLGQNHENNTNNTDFWKFFIEEKSNAEQIIQLSHTMQQEFRPLLQHQMRVEETTYCKWHK
jgi:hypothetical protein